MAEQHDSNGIVLDAYGLSDPGKIREENEDAIICDLESGLFILADGMGGHASGQVASQKAIAVMADYLLNGRYVKESQWPLDPSTKLSELGNQASVALRIANIRVYNEAQKNEDLLGMGTTGIIFITQGEQAVVAHVGDSRCYLHDGYTLARVTNDHSLVNQLMRVFNLSENEAAEKAGKNVLVQSIGIDDDIVPEVCLLKIQKRSTVLLCSDGLTDMLSEPDIQTILEKPNINLEAKAQLLIDSANLAGGRDNISVILITVRAQSHPF